MKQVVLSLNIFVLSLLIVNTNARAERRLFQSGSRGRIFQKNDPSPVQMNMNAPKTEASREMPRAAAAAAAPAHPEAASITIGGGSITFPSITIGEPSHRLAVPGIGQRTWGPSGDAYIIAGGMQLGDLQSGLVGIQNGAPKVYGYMLSVDDSCVIAKSGVQAVNSNDIQTPTRLKSKAMFPEQTHTVHYEYDVNGNDGADLRALVIQMGRKNKGGPLRNIFVSDSCPVTISVRVTP